MSKSKHVSETPATQFLKAHGVAFTEHTYDYVDKGGTTESSRQLGVDEHAVIKTLVMEDEHAKPLIVLMHGDCSVSTKNLARQTGVVHFVPVVHEAIGSAVLTHGWNGDAVAQRHVFQGKGDRKSVV